MKRSDVDRAYQINRHLYQAEKSILALREVKHVVISVDDKTKCKEAVTFSAAMAGDWQHSIPVEGLVHLLLDSVKHLEAELKKLLEAKEEPKS